MISYVRVLRYSWMNQFDEYDVTRMYYWYKNEIQIYIVLRETWFGIIIIILKWILLICCYIYQIFSICLGFKQHIQMYMNSNNVSENCDIFSSEFYLHRQTYAKRISTKYDFSYLIFYNPLLVLQFCNILYSWYIDALNYILHQFTIFQNRYINNRKYKTT